MIGYDEPRPKKEDYDGFINNFVKGLNNLGNDKLSFMVYGSYVRGNHIAGRSDIDGVFIFDADVITDKKEFSEISEILKDSLLKNPVIFQVTPADTTIIKDGRLYSYSQDYIDYFKQEAKVLFGKDYRENMKAPLYKSAREDALAFNLRKSRQSLLLSLWYKEKDYKIFLENFTKSMTSISRGPIEIAYLIGNKLITNKSEALDEIVDLLPNIELESFKRIEILHRDPKKLDDLFHKPEEILKLWNSALTCYESLLREYIYKCPPKAL